MNRRQGSGGPHGSAHGSRAVSWPRSRPGSIPRPSNPSTSRLRSQGTSRSSDMRRHGHLASLIVSSASQRASTTRVCMAGYGGKAIGSNGGTGDSRHAASGNHQRPPQRNRQRPSSSANPFMIEEPGRLCPRCHPARKSGTTVSPARFLGSLHSTPSSSTHQQQGKTFSSPPTRGSLLATNDLGAKSQPPTPAVPMADLHRTWEASLPSEGKPSRSNKTPDKAVITRNI